MVVIPQNRAKCTKKHVMKVQLLCHSYNVLRDNKELLMHFISTIISLVSKKGRRDIIIAK